MPTLAELAQQYQEEEETRLMGINAFEDPRQRPIFNGDGFDFNRPTNRGPAMMSVGRNLMAKGDYLDPNGTGPGAWVGGGLKGLIDHGTEQAVNLDQALRGIGSRVNAGYRGLMGRPANIDDERGGNSGSPSGGYGDSPGHGNARF